MMGAGDRLIINTAPTPATIILPPNRPGTHQSLFCFVGAFAVAVDSEVGEGFTLVCPWTGNDKVSKLAVSRTNAGRQGANT